MARQTFAGYHQAVSRVAGQRAAASAKTRSYLRDEAPRAREAARPVADSRPLTRIIAMEKTELTAREIEALAWSDTTGWGTIPAPDLLAWSWLRDLLRGTLGERRPATAEAR
jgi:hypothetical protein